MFRRNNGNEQSNDQVNILGGKAFTVPQQQAGVQAYPQGGNQQNKFFSNFDQEISEVSGSFGRVNPTSNSSTIRLAHAGISQEHFPGTIQANQDNSSDINLRSQTKSVTVTQSTHQIPRVIPSSNLNQPPTSFVTGSNTLTPIRTESTYTIGTIQNRAPIIGTGVTQIQNQGSFIRQEPTVSRVVTHQHYGSTTPVNNSRTNLTLGTVLVTSEQKNVRQSISGDQSQQKYDPIFKTTDNFATLNYTSLPSNQLNYHQTFGTVSHGNSFLLQKEPTVSTIKQEYTTLPSIAGLRKINNPSDIETGLTKPQVNHAATGPIVIQQKVNPQTNQEKHSPKSGNKLAHIPSIRNLNEEKSTRSSYKFDEVTASNKKYTQIESYATPVEEYATQNSAQQLSHRSITSQQQIDYSQNGANRVSKNQTQRMSLGNFIETAVTGTTPIRAALRKQSQPTTVNLTFHDTSKLQKESQEGDINPTTDRKKEWRPLVPENELIQNPPNQTSTHAPLEQGQLNTSYRHITPPPAQRTAHTRTINQAINAQSLGRFEQVTTDQSAKIVELEKQLAKMMQIANNLQKEKELALKFNSLLLRKLENVGVGSAEAVLQVN